MSYVCGSQSHATMVSDHGNHNTLRGVNRPWSRTKGVSSFWVHAFCKVLDNHADPHMYTHTHTHTHMYAHTHIHTCTHTDTGVIKDGVQVTPLRERVTNGWCNMAAVRHVEGLTPQQRSDMKKTLRDFMQETKDRPYETNKLQLVLSSTDFLDEPFNLLNLNEEDLSSVFCSELVAAAYQRMGLIDRTKCSNRYTPEDFTTRRGLEIMMGTLGPEIYIDLKAMMEDNRRLEKTPLSD